MLLEDSLPIRLLANVTRADVIGDDRFQFRVAVGFDSCSRHAVFGHRESSFAQQAVQRLQSSEQQSRDGGFGLAEFRRDLGQAESLQVVQDNRVALSIGGARR